MRLLNEKGHQKMLLHHGKHYPSHGRSLNVLPSLAFFKP